MTDEPSRNQVPVRTRDVVGIVIVWLCAVAFGLARIIAQWSGSTVPDPQSGRIIPFIEWIKPDVVYIDRWHGTMVTVMSVPFYMVIIAGGTFTVFALASIAWKRIRTLNGTN